MKKWNKLKLHLIFRLLIDVTLPVQLATNEDVLGCLKTVEKTIREHDPKLRRVEKVLAEMRRRKDESSLSSKVGKAT